MRIKLLNTDFLLQLILYLLWISLIFSINTSLNDIKIFTEKINFFSLINFLRFFAPFLLFILLIIILYKKNFSLKKVFLFNNLNTIFALFFILGIVSIMFFFKIDELFFHSLENVYLLFTSIIAIINIQILSQLKLKKNLRLLFYFSITIYFLIASILFFSKFNVWLDRVDFYSYSLFSVNEIPGLLQPYPRTTGISRMFSLSFLLCFVFIFNLKLTFKYKIFFFIILIFSGSMIWGFQSRGTIVCLLSALIFFIIIERQKFLLRFIQIVCILFCSIIFYEISALSLKKQINVKNTLIDVVIEKKILETNNNTNSYLSNKIKNSESQNRIFTTNQTTTGRYDLWVNALENYNFSKVFGYGPQADRFIIDKNLASFVGNNVSNAYLSLFLMGGYFVLPLILFFLLRLGLILISYIYYNNYLTTNHKPEIYVSFLFAIFFLTRSIFENSFSVFGTDFIIFLISITILELNSKKFTFKDLFKILKLG